MKILVTAGATMVMIDKVRAVTNIFRGRTGTELACRLAASRDNKVTLVTSSPELLLKSVHHGDLEEMRVYSGFRTIKYRTFDELAIIMEEEIKNGGYDVVIHSAAVSDYEVAGVFLRDGEQLVEVDSSTKIASGAENMFWQLKPTYKIVDKIRQEWGFKGKLVKFKLQVGMSEEELVAIARQSRVVSEADFVVANCLEWSQEKALIIDRQGTVKRVNRVDLPKALEKELTE